MECFRIDESGYTGFDLLNLEQRFQGAAAIAITITIDDHQARRLIQEHREDLSVARELPPAGSPDKQILDGEFFSKRGTDTTESANFRKSQLPFEKGKS
ncbi:hypothetical protein SJT37_18855 [Aeromonas caviae]|uniref:hypothetical protein n=1 Tax=Aeromonas caviae TaxID=648 RepID=UPI0029D9EBD1|nr:hypothetical protein [Aeromonas caviae]MDX7677582.1 hypothetical protein [Aeromonas caviae]